LNKTDQTAILVFSRSAHEEAKAKNFTKHFGKKSGFALANQLINYTLSEAKKSQLPVFSDFLNYQQGNNFGERLANAIEEVFSFGFAKVIVIGGDSPSINSPLLKQINQTLIDHDLVIGPAADGGVYFIGVSKNGYSRNNFIHIPWLTPHVFDAFKNYASILKLSFATGSLGEDVDDIASFQHWLKNAFFHKLYAVLKIILPLAGKIKRPVLKLVFHQPYSSASTLRGPPFFLFNL
jgi:hypothetical protein